MKLKLITGPSGSGKSFYICNKIIAQSIKEPDTRFIFIVPEQASMQTQKELVRLHPSHSIVNIDVLSFNRLAYRVFSETGRGNAPVIDDLGKTLIIQKVLRGCGKDLGPYKKVFERPGTAEKMKSLISEFMQYRVSPADLNGIGERDDLPAYLKLKLADILLVYEKYKAYLSKKYLCAEEIPEILAGSIADSSLIRDAVIVIDGFTGFVPTQLPVIEQLIAHSREVNAVITTGRDTKLFGKADENDIFYLSMSMAADLVRCARAAGAEIEGPFEIAPGEGRFSEKSALSFLEENIFRYNGRAYDGTDGSVGLFAADNINQEARYIASVIKKKVREDGLRYGDFAVVTGDLEHYGEILENMFASEDIPCFLDKKLPVLHNPLVEFIRGAAQMCRENFSYDGVFRFLKCGLSDFTAEETDLLENYVLAAGIRGKKQWFGEWTRITKNFKAEDLDALNSLRERFENAVSGFAAAYAARGSTAGEKTRALYGLITASSAEAKLKVIEEAYEARGKTAEAREYARIYKAVMDLFDRICEVMGDEPCGMEAFGEILDAGFSEMRVGYIPIGQDRVIIGDITRSRVKNMKVLFFAGVNDGIIPAEGDKAGILTREEREELSLLGMTLSPDGHRDMCDQRLYLYLNLSAPSEALYVSYSLLGSDGAKKQPSYLIGVLKDMFPKMETLSSSSKETKELFLETKSGREALILKAACGALSEEEKGRFLSIVSFLSESVQGRHRLEKLHEAMDFKNNFRDISSGDAAKLYGEDPWFSVSGLQKFAVCAFSYFCMKGLALNEREIREFEARDRGDILHTTIENFVKKVTERRIPWDSLDDDMRDAIVDEVFDNISAEYNNAILSESGSGDAKSKAMRRVAEKAAWALSEQIKRGSFLPRGTEVPYTAKKLRGTIDRLDTCEYGGRTYVRVVDYKTGSEGLNFGKMFSGLQIQLPVYMMAALDTVRDSDPAGFYYHHVKEPLVEIKTMDEEPTEEKLLWVLRLLGLSRSEPELISLSDPELFENPENRGRPVSSNVINAAKKKDGDYTKSSSVASGEDFKLINEFIEKKTSDMEEEIKKGRVAVNPFENKKRDYCTYCAYAPVCCFDERIPGFEKKEIPKFEKSEDAFAGMREYLDKSKEDNGA